MILSGKPVPAFGDHALLLARACWRALFALERVYVTTAAPPAKVTMMPASTSDADQKGSGDEIH